MIPEKTLEIIQREVDINYPGDMREHQKRAWINGAKRGYELAMGDRWIEIREEGQYPENNQEVLIYTDPVICNAVYTDRNGRGFEFLNLGYSFDNTEPTHWQPLPSPPKPKP